MKKNILYIFLLTSLLSFSQTEKDNYDKISKEFIKLYNAANYEAIFNLFDANMKKALPKEKSLAFFKNNVAPAGKINKMELHNIIQTSHVYKTTFDNAILNVAISLDKNNKINGFQISQHIPKNLPKLERNTTQMILPFNEEWTVFWGGTTIDKNYHVAYNNQKYAYDLVITKDGKTHRGDSKKNKNYYVFGKKIIAPCDAKVVKVIKGVHDNIPGEMNPNQLTGNTIILETKNKEFILFAHLKENSIAVREGQYIKQGELLGLCGNSGNSSEPHLHLSLQNTIDMSIATGGKLFFHKIKVNGNVKEDYIPTQNDKIQNIKL